jgi:hypothetical protein
VDLVNNGLSDPFRFMLVLACRSNIIDIYKHMVLLSSDENDEKYRRGSLLSNRPEM